MSDSPCGFFYWLLLVSRGLCSNRTTICCGPYLFYCYTRAVNRPFRNSHRVSLFAGFLRRIQVRCDNLLFMCSLIQAKRTSLWGLSSNGAESRAMASSLLDRRTISVYARGYGNPCGTYTTCSSRTTTRRPTPSRNYPACRRRSRTHLGDCCSA